MFLVALSSHTVPASYLQFSEGEACDGQCVALTRNLTTAQFTSRGDMILVELSTRAKTLDRPCSDLFDSTTMALLGTSRCVIRDDVSGRTAVYAHFVGVLILLHVHTTVCCEAPSTQRGHEQRCRLACSMIKNYCVFDLLW